MRPHREGNENGHARDCLEAEQAHAEPSLCTHRPWVGEQRFQGISAQQATAQHDGMNPPGVFKVVEAVDVVDNKVRSCLFLHAFQPG